jgi:lipase chaperone LimK
LQLITFQNWSRQKEEESALCQKSALFTTIIQMKDNLVTRKNEVDKFSEKLKTLLSSAVMVVSP